MSGLRKTLRAGAWFLGCVLIICIALLARIYRQGSFSDIQKSDAIIVLGAAQRNGEPSPIFQARLDHAHKVYEQGYADSIIVTGGKVPGSPASDSAIGKVYLVRLGIPSNRIYIEEQSRTTLENLILARDIMEVQSLRSAILVSHDFHMMRARQMAHDLNIRVFPAPMLTKSRSVKLHYAMREVMVYAAYLLFHI